MFCRDEAARSTSCVDDTTGTGQGTEEIKKKAFETYIAFSIILEGLEEIPFGCGIAYQNDL